MRHRGIERPTTSGVAGRAGSNVGVRHRRMEPRSLKGNTMWVEVERRFCQFAAVRLIPTIQIRSNREYFSLLFTADSQ